MTREGPEETEPILDVLDLPPLYSHPSLSTLIATLDLLAIPPPSWDLPDAAAAAPPTAVRIHGNPTPWLTTLVSSPLRWLANDALREQVWDAAAVRLAERCGRTAMPAFDRTFRLSDRVQLTIHEPTLDGDNLGLKTWGAAYALAKRMAHEESMRSAIHHCLFDNDTTTSGENYTSTAGKCSILELGAGTGLAGLAVAATISTASTTARIHVHLTDLPEILPNLDKNIQLNSALLPPSVAISSTTLDWRVNTTAPRPADRYPLIIAADPIYSAEHPQMLATVVAGWLERSPRARFIVELPLRKLFAAEVTDFRCCMLKAGLVAAAEGTESARDDWGDGGEAMTCWWAVYAWDTAEVGVALAPAVAVAGSVSAVSP